ncbi:MAG: GNAT family N-acetyltransferase [Parcubacteria group bacterium]|nr:GNAT family N-acetyltransferase [Parcubacteria group bacterium]
MNTHIVSLSHPKLAKVYLRPFEKDDLQRCCRWINDPEVRRFLSTQSLPSLQKEEEWYNSLQKSDNDVVLAIISKENHAHIGNIGLHRIDWINRRGTTGALIGEKEYWAKGYGTEAKLLLLKHAFDTLGLEKICSNVFSNNPRSKAYLEKTGYREEGCRRRHFLVDGKKVDDYIMAIFREDFEPVWEKYCGE